VPILCPSRRLVTPFFGKASEEGGLRDDGEPKPDIGPAMRKSCHDPPRTP
jgi:hypothetical protein